MSEIARSSFRGLTALLPPLSPPLPSITELSATSPEATTPPATGNGMQRRTAVTALIAVNLLWGLSFPIARVLNLEIQEHFEPGSAVVSSPLLIQSSAWIIFMRFAIATGLLLIFCRRLVASVRWPHWWAGSAIGALFFAGLFLQVAGLSNMPASRSGFLTSLVVVWTPIFATVLQRQRPRRQTIVGAAVSVLGVVILTGMLELDARGVRFADDALGMWGLGETLTSISVLFFALQVIALDTYGKRYESTALTPSMFVTTTLLAGIVFAAWHLTGSVGNSVAVVGSSAAPETMTSWIGLTAEPRFWIPVAVLSVFSTLIAFLWMNRYQPVLTAGQAAVIYTLEPLFASGWAMFLPGWISVMCLVSYENEVLSWHLVIGGSLLIVANVIALWPAIRVSRKSGRSRGSRTSKAA